MDTLDTSTQAKIINDPGMEDDKCGIHGQIFWKTEQETGLGTGYRRINFFNLFMLICALRGYTCMKYVQYQ